MYHRGASETQHPEKPLINTKMATEIGIGREHYEFDSKSNERGERTKSSKDTIKIIIEN